MEREGGALGPAFGTAIELLRRDLAGLSGINWDKWDSAGRGRGAEGTEQAAHTRVVRNRLARARRVAGAIAWSARHSRYPHLPWCDPVVGDAPCAPHHVAES